jgi:hypothetical protein
MVANTFIPFDMVWAPSYSYCNTISNLYSGTNCFITKCRFTEDRKKLAWGVDSSPYNWFPVNNRAPLGNDNITYTDPNKVQNTSDVLTNSSYSIQVDTGFEGSVFIYMSDWRKLNSVGRTTTKTATVTVESPYYNTSSGNNIPGSPLYTFTFNNLTNQGNGTRMRITNLSTMFANGCYLITYYDITNKIVIFRIDDNMGNLYFSVRIQITSAHNIFYGTDAEPTLPFEYGLDDNGTVRPIPKDVWYDGILYSKFLLPFSVYSTAFPSNTDFTSASVLPV